MNMSEEPLQKYIILLKISLFGFEIKSVDRVALTIDI